VRIVLRRGAQDELRLAVHDDGIGIDPRGAAQGLGLLGAIERAAALGGRLEIRSAPGSGTTLEAELPAPRSTP
jgi:two-component system sensor histidine kinase UhpB